MHTLILSFFLSLAHGSPLRVLIDPGHGGRDHGTEKNGVTESSLVLNIAKQLDQRLSQDKRFRPYLTRSNDQLISLSNRARMAKDLKADVFLSIHINSSPDARAKGAEFYFQNQLPPDEESMLLAHMENNREAGAEHPHVYEAIDSSLPSEISAILTDLLDADRIRRSSSLSTALKVAWRGSKKSRANSVLQAPFFVLSQMATPSTLVELGFITNTDDFRDLTSPASQGKMVEDLYRGLLRYLESTTTINHATRQPTPQ